MTSIVSFKTRARTVDHLGREQIADCPTAVSELWKNAYDAYARSVSLHIFEGDTPIAGILDDGCGMNKEDFIEKWLVLGTESKFQDIDHQSINRYGLPFRDRQGQKGIGRLSVAALGPLVLVLSKQYGRPFMAALVDWRLFENPYLSMEDIGCPLVEFDSKTEFHSIFPSLVDGIVQNIEGNPSLPMNRQEWIKEAWNRFSTLENENWQETTTAQRILASASKASIHDRHLSQWDVWAGTSDQGTALFILDINYELAVWVMNDINESDDEVTKIRRRLFETLSGFSDPYKPNLITFDYQVVAHKGNREHDILSHDSHFSLGEFRNLEHVIEGSFDEYGLFTGRLRAFGVDRGEINIAPTRPAHLRAREKVGPFEFCIATFEMDPVNSTHPPTMHEHLAESADRYGGIMVYRDGLRVMPYGRSTNDFFGIEERRSKNAGRYFWAHRRSFGSVSLSRQNNPNLRDKAGREGFIDNRASREMRLLIENVLQTSARKYFGSDSDLRQKLLPEINQRNRAEIEATEKSRKHRRTLFREALKENSAPLNRAIELAELTKQTIDAAANDDNSEVLLEVSQYIERLVHLKSDLALPRLPAKLGKLEEEYRSYRDRYKTLLAAVDSINKRWQAAVDTTLIQNPLEVAESALSRHQKHLNDALGKWQKAAKNLLNSEIERIDSRINKDRAAYYAQTSPLLSELSDEKIKASIALNEMEAIREECYLSFSSYYTSYIRSLTQLAEGIDLDGAIAWSGDQNQELKLKVDQISSLSQLGITIEIIGHELSNLDSEVTRNLNRLPEDVRQLDAYKLALNAHKELVARLRFLAPLKLSGSRERQSISGEMIAQYVSQFFRQKLETSRITLEVTPEFKGLRISENQSRIYSVFINLVNNSIYWLTFSPERKIKLDYREGFVIIGDSGPGVDEDDVENLFQLFFTRRAEGRGVGLYLCKENLSASGHQIHYTRDQDLMVLSGANFVIRFRGIDGDE